MEATGGQPTVLVIDDEPAILRSLQRLLRREFAVRVADSGAAGLAVLRQEPIQVIIADERMPGMTGADFLGQAANEYPDAIRLLLTGYADLPSIIAAINNGHIYRYLMKPWNPDEVVATVREAAEKYRLLVENRTLLDQLQAANAALEARVTARTLELAATNAQLQQANRFKDELLAISSHDLRSLLTSIRVAAQLLGHPRRAAEPARYVQTITQTTDRMLVLINDLSDLAQINTGAVRLERTPVQLSASAHAAVQALTAPAEAKGIQVRVAVPDPEPFIMGDANRLYQVLSNLVGNALKFTPPDGQVDIRIAADGPDVVVQIADSGIGIPPDLLPRIFDRFRHQSRPGTAGEPGTGLGLAIVQRLVELHDGGITVESVEGQGSTFTVRLPALPA